MTTRLLIARHGNTFGPGDVVTRVGGRTDLPLVTSGLEQGRKLGVYLRDNNMLPDVVITSALKRAIQTAEQALVAAGIKRTIGHSHIFNEIDYGVDENRPEEEVKARVGEAALKAWDESAIVPDGWNVNVPGLIKSWLGFGEMVADEFKDKTTLVVTSNGIARFAPYITGDYEGFRKQYKLKISTGAVCVFVYDNNRWVVEGWNIKP